MLYGVLYLTFIGVVSHQAISTTLSQTTGRTGRRKGRCKLRAPLTVLPSLTLSDHQQVAKSRPFRLSSFLCALRLCNRCYTGGNANPERLLRDTKKAPSISRQGLIFDNKKAQTSRALLSQCSSTTVKPFGMCSDYNIVDKGKPYRVWSLPFVNDALLLYSTRYAITVQDTKKDWYCYQPLTSLSTCTRQRTANRHLQHSTKLNGQCFPPLTMPLILRQQGVCNLMEHDTPYNLIWVVLDNTAGQVD